MTSSKRQKISLPGFSDECYPDVYGPAAMPKQPKELKPGQLEEEKIRHYFEKGWLIIPDYFKKEQLDACKKDIEKLVEKLANKLFKGGKITRLHEDKGFYERLTCLEKDFPGVNILLHKMGALTKSFSDLWSDERLLNMVEQLIGPEIMGHPVWNLRTKTPQNEATTVPWHQDNAYLDNDAYGVLQPGIWVPLIDANRNNGCMEVISGGHLKGKVAKHTCCSGETWYVVLDEKDMERDLGVDVEKDKVLCPVPYGGMLIINNMIPHRSLNNLSNDIRWSLDLRWQVPDKPIGFYGMKEGVMMRSKKNPVKAIDWDGFNEKDRHEIADKECSETTEDEEYNTIIVGPWMKKWEITHTNRHTEALSKNDQLAWNKA